MLAGGRGTGRFPRRNLCLVRVVALSPAGHLWVGCSAQLAGWLIDAVFRRKVVRSKTISPAKRFRPSCSGRMAHSCPAYDTDRTPILEIWQIFRIQSWMLFRFVQGFGILTDPGIGSLRELARAIAPGKKAEPPPIFFVKKDLHSRKKHRRQRKTPPTPVCCCKRSTLLSHRYKVWAFQHITIVPSDPPFRLFAETCRTEIVLMFQAAVLGASLAYAVRPIAASLSAPSPAHPNRYLPNRIAAGIQTPRYRSIRQKIRRLSRSRK